MSDTAPKDQRPMKFWFLSYMTLTKIRPEQPPTPPIYQNVVLADVHPLVWLSQPPEIYRKTMVSVALSFHEIDEATFNEVRRLNYISAEDSRLQTADV